MQIQYMYIQVRDISKVLLLHTDYFDMYSDEKLTIIIVIHSYV